MKRQIFLGMIFLIFLTIITFFSINYINSSKFIGNNIFKEYKSKVIKNLELEILETKDERKLNEKFKDYILGKEVEFFTSKNLSEDVKEFKIKIISHRKNIIVEIKKIYNDGNYEISNIINKLLNNKLEISIEKFLEKTYNKTLYNEKHIIENDINGLVQKFYYKDNNIFYIENYELNDGKIASLIVQTYKNKDILTINPQNNSAIAIYSNGDKEEFLNFKENINLENKSGNSIYIYDNGISEKREY